MKIEEIDLLRLQNLSMRVAMAKRDLDDFGNVLNAKYNNGQPGLTVAEDGTIVPPAEDAHSLRAVGADEAP